MNLRRLIIGLIFLVMLYLGIDWALSHPMSSWPVTIPTVIVGIFGPLFLVFAFAKGSKEWRSDSVYETAYGQNVLATITQNTDVDAYWDWFHSLILLMMAFYWYFLTAWILCYPFNLILSEMGISDPFINIILALAPPHTNFGLIYWLPVVIVFFIFFFISTHRDERKRMMEQVAAIIIFALSANIIVPLAIAQFILMGYPTTLYFEWYLNELSSFLANMMLSVSLFVAYIVIAIGVGKQIISDKAKKVKALNAIIITILLLSTIMELMTIIGGGFDSESTHLITSMLSIAGLESFLPLTLTIGVLILSWMIGNAHMSFADYGLERSRILFLAVICMIIYTFWGLEIWRLITPIVHGTPSIVTPNVAYARAIGYVVGLIIGVGYKAVKNYI